VKKVAFVIMLLVAVLCKAQDPQLSAVFPLSSTGSVVYTAIVPVDSTIKSDLYSRAKGWFVDVFKSANNVIQSQDKDEGQIIGRGFFQINWMMNALAYARVDVYFKVTIVCKDNRYKYEFSDIQTKKWTTGSYGVVTPGEQDPIEHWNAKGPKIFRFTEENSNRFFTQVDKEFKAIISTLKTAMSTPTISQKDDW